ncbi:uncharacterized protein PV09_09182 [Verruconis gallopava]|uniref:Major facilitator superfamily (MFS) profile domain-containing protein n=1 Tax=Verruconis gallopava TaxID=253628 RepID=A0A0D1XA87_9PEZI|nr:uncharacterized protein PV09_09182 [Verruconis gallopava]KIV99075.1 hypothetical protein PV09_09182 [Verruconis gallopava]
MGESIDAKLERDVVNQRSPDSSPRTASVGSGRLGARPACFDSTIQEVLFVITCTMAIALSSMTAGVVSVITSFVGRDLNMTNAEITWISAASSLAAGSFLLFFGKLADLFGRRSMFVVSLFTFSILALGAGFARKPVQLDVLCGFIGLMSAGAVPSAQGMLSTAYDQPSRRKNAAFACFSSGNPLGFVFGMLSGGIASQIFSWRASFWFLALVYCLFTVIAAFTIPRDTVPRQPFNTHTLGRFDLLGVLLTIVGTGTFSAALSLGSQVANGWKTGYVIALLVVGVICMVSFVIWELYCPTPLLDMHIFRDRNFSLLLAILLLGFMSFSSSAFWLSLYIQRVYRTSSIMTAVYLLPMAIAGLMVNVVAGAVMHRISNKLLMGIAASAFTLAYLLFALNATRYPFWAMLFLGQVFSVVGVDLQFNVVNMYVMSSLPKDQQSVAGGFFQMTTRLVNTIGLGVTTALFSSVERNPPKSGLHAGDPAAPYSATFWFATAACGLSLLLVPWLTIRTQGHSEKKENEEMNAVAAYNVTLNREKDTDAHI